jgi:hypothetical protein
VTHHGSLLDGISGAREHYAEHDQQRVDSDKISGSVNIQSTTESDCVRTLPTPASPTLSAARMKPFIA